jgi:type IV pilus assembly protein PilB
LARKICASCVHSLKPTKEIINLFKEYTKNIGAKLALPSIVYQGRGCSACGFSGYRGQTGIFEILYVSDEIRNLVIAKSAVNVIKKQAQKEGMRLMIEDGLDKIEKGLITVEEVLRVAVE